MDYQAITPIELADRLERGEKLRLIDVREPVEYELARFEGAQLLPLSQFNEWATALLDSNETIVFICHHGVRSAQVCQFLARNGFSKLYNLAGGIDRWSVEVDRGVPRY